MMTERRKLTAMILVGCLWLLLVGMGSNGGELQGPIQIPTPDKRFVVTLTDRDAVTTRLTYFSNEGMVFFAGTLGRGQVALAFDRIKAIAFHFQGKKLLATAELKNNQRLTFAVDRKLRVMGRVSYGNYRIDLGNVRRIVFH
jgi:hypothetical protein